MVPLTVRIGASVAYKSSKQMIMDSGNACSSVPIDMTAPVLLHWPQASVASFSRLSFSLAIREHYACISER